MMTVAKILVVFAVGLVAAMLRVLFTRRAAEGHAAAAATYHTAISFSAAVGTILYVNEWRMIPALLAGCWLGTYFAVRRDANVAALKRDRLAYAAACGHTTRLQEGRDR